MNEEHEKRIQAERLTNRKRHIARLFGDLSFPEMVDMLKILVVSMVAKQENYYE